MSFKAKVKVKSLFIKEKTEEASCDFAVTFMPVEKTEVCGKTFFMGIDEAGTTNEITKQFPTNVFKNIPVKKELFDFLSNHSKETFIITIDDNKGKQRLEEVELIYG